MGIISNFQRNVRNAAKDAFGSVGEDYNINLESRDLQRISKSRMLSEAKDIASTKLIDTDSGIFADFKNFGRNLKQQLFGAPNTNREEIDSWDFDDIGFNASGLSGRTGLTAGALNDSARRSSEAIGGAVISGTNRQIKASSILMSGLINEVKVGNTLLKGILDSLNDKTFREASLKYYTESLVALKNIERGVQFQTEERNRDDGEALKPSEFAKQLASLDLHGITKSAKNVLLSTVDKQGMIKLIGGVATSLFESLMGEDGLKSMFKTGMEQILKKKMGESFGMDMEAFMSDPAMLMERLLQRGKVSNSSIIRMFSKRTASTVNSAFDTTQDIKDPKGKANFDVAAHTALTHVLPHKLDKIYSAITGSQLETYDYTKNRWVTVEDAAAMFAKERPDVDTAIGDVLSKIKDIVNDKKMGGFTDANGELLFGKSMAKLMTGLASKGGELKGIANANEKALADEYGLTIPEAVRIMEMVRMLMSDKDGNDTVASADRDILNLVNEVQSYNAKMKDSYSANRLFQNGGIDNITLAQGDNVLGKLLGKGKSTGSGILSALAEVEGYGSVLKVFAVNGFGGPKRGKGAGGPSSIINAVNNELDMRTAEERISKGASVEYSNYLNDMNKIKDAENETSGTRAAREKDALEAMTKQYNAKHGTNLKPEEIKTMMELYSYLRGTGMGGPSIFQMYKDMNGGGSKDWDKWSESERNKKINPQSWEDIDLSLFTNDVKDRASHYVSKGSMSKRSFSLEDPINSSINILKDLYRDPNMVGKIHGGAGAGLGAVMGTVFQKTTGIGGIYAPIIGTMLGGAMSMSKGFQSMSNQLLGEAGDEQIGGVKRRQRVMEKIFQQVLPSVIGGSVAGKFAGKVIGKFLPYGSILGPIGSLVVGAVTGGLLYQTNLMSKALGDTKFGKFMEKIPVIGQYFKSRKDEREAGTTSTDASFKDLTYGNMNEDRTEYDSSIADDTQRAYEEYNEVLKEFMDELKEIRSERNDIDQDITDYNNEKAEIKASQADASVKRSQISALDKKYAVAIKEYKNINSKLEVLGRTYKKKLKDAIKGKIPDDKIDALVDSAIASGFVKGSKDHLINKVTSAAKGAGRSVTDTFGKLDSWLMGDEQDEDVENAKVDANKEFADEASKWYNNPGNESFAGSAKQASNRSGMHRANTGPSRGAGRKYNNSGEGEGGPQKHYYQKDTKWSNMADSSPILNISTSGCAIMTAMSVASRLLDMKVENPKYFIKVAAKYINPNGVDSGYFEELFKSLGASVVRYKNVKSMSTEARTILFTNMGKAWGLGGSVVALIEQPDRGNKHFVSFSRISTTIHKATMHDPNSKEPVDVYLGDLAPVIHELIYIVPEKNTVELAYKKKVVTKDELEGADYDTSTLKNRSLWDRATDSRIGKHDLGDLGKKFNNLGDDFLSWVENDDPPEGKIANALLYGVVGAVDMLTGTIKGIGRGLTKGFKMALKAMGPLGQLMSVGWKLGVGATKMLWGAGKLGAKLLWGVGKFARKVYKRGKNKGAILKELRAIYNTDVQLRADGVIVDTSNDMEIGRLMANGDIMDMDGKNVMGNIPMDLMTASGMDKSINAGGKRNILGLIGEKGLKGAWQTVRDRKNKKLEDAAKENAEKAKRFTRGETMFEDMRDALAEVLADTPIRTEVEGGMLDAVGATGATDVDAVQEMLKSADSAGGGKRNPRSIRDIRNKRNRLKRALKGRTVEEIDKFQDEEADREERKIKALESRHEDGGGMWSKIGGFLPMLMGGLIPLLGALPGLLGLKDKLTGNAVNLNQASSLWKAAKGGGKLLGNATKNMASKVAGATGGGTIAKMFKRSFGSDKAVKGVDIALDTLDKVDGVGNKARKMVMDILSWLVQKGGKILPATWLAKLTNILTNITGVIQKKMAKIMLNPKVSPAFAATKNIPFVNIAFAIWDFIKGYKDAEEFLGLPDDAVTTGMRVAVAVANGFISTLAAFISSAITVGSGGVALGASVVINLIVGAINPGWLAKEIYNMLGDDLDKQASKKLSDKKGKETKVETTGNLFSYSGNEKAKIEETSRSVSSEDRQSDGQSAFSRIGNTFKNIFSPTGGSNSNSGMWNNILGTETADVNYASDGSFPLPNKNSPVSSTFGLRRHPISGEFKDHKGIDFAVATGTPIYAMADGKIEKAGMGSGGAGLMIILKGKDGVVYKYMHLHSIKVKEGQDVTKGQLIATSGGDPKKDGKNAGGSTGAHLHFQMEKDGKAFDPVKALQIDHANILKGPNNKENEKYLASNPQTSKATDSKGAPDQSSGDAPKGSGYDGISKEAEAALLAIPGLLEKLIAAVKSNAPKGESTGSDSPIDFNSLLQGMRGASGSGTPAI